MWIKHSTHTLVRPIVSGKGATKGIFSDTFRKGNKGISGLNAKVTVGGVNKENKTKVTIMSKEDDFLKDLLRVSDTKGLTQWGDRDSQWEKYPTRDKLEIL